MKIFVTGGTGYIGSYIVLELVRQGHEITVLTRNPHAASALLEQPNVTALKGGVDEDDIVRPALEGHQVLVHNAVMWDDEPTELELRDVRASAMLFDAAVKAGVEHAIYTSSTAVHRPFAGRMDESSSLRPADLYGATKAAGEIFLSALAQPAGMKWTVIRAGPVVGPPAFEGGEINSVGRFDFFARSAVQGDPIQVTKHEARQFIAAADLARVFGVVVRGEAEGGVYLAVSEDHMSWQEIAETALQETGSSAEIEVLDSDLPADPPFFDTKRMSDNLGLSFRCREAVLEHIREAVRAQGQRRAF